MKLSIIIVNYNVTALLRNCLHSIQKYIRDTAYEVIVIDNLSTDHSWKELQQEFPGYHFIANTANEGFAVANNKAAKTALGEYLLLLNPDTELEGEYMKTILDFSDAKQNFGCLGIRMHDAKGTFLPESKRSVPGLFNSFEKLFAPFGKNTSQSYYRNDIGEYDIAETDVITGAFFLCKRSDYDQVGGLDERYFMYGEDIDLCYTFQQKGYRNFYYGKASLLHHKGESTVKDEIYLERFFGAMQIFVDKYYAEKPLQRWISSVGLQLKHRLEKAKLHRNNPVKTEEKTS